MNESQAEKSVSRNLERNLSFSRSFVLGSPSYMKFCRLFRFPIDRVF